jgi:hypothetical protein
MCIIRGWRPSAGTRTEVSLEAIAETRTALSEEIVSSFDEDVREFARD